MGEKYLNEPKLQLLLLLQLVITTYKAQYLTNFLVRNYNMATKIFSLDYIRKDSLLQ